jgi:predicted ABC-type ATPase
MRMFAGPNGSGKSVLKSYLSPRLLGVYLNPDEIQRDIELSGFLDLSVFGVSAPKEEVLGFFRKSELLRRERIQSEAERLAYINGRLDFSRVAMNAYFAAVLVDLLRRKLIEQRMDFTFETVMSHPGKVDLLAEARSKGYRTYLYYVATDDPQINISRVQNRVATGGHDVPSDKIEERYHRSLALLMKAIANTDRAYLFDNSTDSASGEQTWLAEVTGGKEMEFKTKQIRAWFMRSVLDQGWHEVPSD